MNSFLKSKIFHPFLFAAFPVLFLFAENVNMVATGQVWPPLAIILLFALLFFLLSWLLLRNLYKAGLFTSAFVVLFFLYRPAFSAVQHAPLVGSLAITRHREFLPFFLLPFLGFGWYLFRSKNDFTKTSGILNLTAFILLLPSMLRLCGHAFQPQVQLKPRPAETLGKTDGKAPDVYYFIMDAYGRHDVLKKTFGFDNRPFLDALEQRGFYIAEKSTSNYYRTDLSVPSTLNFNYLQKISESGNSKKRQGISAKELVRNSRLRNSLKAKKYKYVCFESGVDFTEIEDADYYVRNYINFSEFDIAVLNTSPLPDVFHGLISKDLYDMHRATILYPFQNLNKAISIPGPTFVQIHVLAPHPPFVFDRNGNPVQPDHPLSLLDANHFLSDGTRSEYLAGYSEQVRFLNTKLLCAVDTILKHTSSPPVIIIQGDHGVRINTNFERMNATNHQEAFANLSAFYFPSQDTAGLYPEISNVNTFRVVLNKYFNARLPLLPDKNYYSTISDPYSFTDVTKAVRTKKTGPVNTSHQQ